MRQSHKPAENQGKTGIPTLSGFKSRQPSDKRSSPYGVGQRRRQENKNRCPSCNAHVINYEYDDNVGCYFPHTCVDPTPLTRDLIAACRVTGRGLFTHHRDRAGRRHLSRIWAHQPLPAGDITVLPEHECGARIPTTLPPLRTNTIPEQCPF